ncbi:hypothetical protein CRM22_001387 [Opisthorchis felineus]|uniref:Uncharacterized protein n=1 Tax=Opisthorchis felineus TaxID=147828 RepID=A0A4S2MB04_OPIFE|nr:hypothetical protein CRM22_001387 [Opisthorchis felineus]
MEMLYTPQAIIKKFNVPFCGVLFIVFRSKCDRHESHHSSSRHRRHRHRSHSRSPSRSREQEIEIQMKPLVLASENETTRQNEIDYIEGSSFTQKSFSSSRSHPKPFAPDSSGPIASATKSQYSSMLAERAHEAAIFGQLAVPPSSTVLGSDPSESKERLVSSVDTVKQLIHPQFDKPDETAWDNWLIRLRELKEARAKAAAKKVRPANGVAAS